VMVSYRLNRMRWILLLMVCKMAVILCVAMCRMRWILLCMVRKMMVILRVAW